MGKYWIAEVRIRKSSLPGFEKGKFRANFVRTRPGEPALMWSSSPFLEKRYHEPANWAEFLRENSAGVNLLKNSSFETLTPSGTPEAWSLPRKLPAGNSVALDKDQSVCGMNSMKITCSGRKPVVFGCTQRITGMKPNTRYRLSFFVKYSGVIPAGNAAGVCVNLNDAGNRWFPFPRLHGSSNWSFHSFEFTSKPGTNAKYVPYVSCSIVACEKGTVWFDGLSLEEIK